MLQNMVRTNPQSALAFAKKAATAEPPQVRFKFIHHTDGCVHLRYGDLDIPLLRRIQSTFNGNKQAHTAKG